jgi:hypothetical protein
MKVAVAGFFRTAGQSKIWDIATNPIVNWFTQMGKKIRGEPSTEIRYEDLPDWWKELPDSRLRGAENYDK